MSIPEGYTTVSAVIPVEVRDELQKRAREQGVSMTKLLAPVLYEYAQQPEVDPVKHTARSNGRELFVSLPRGWCREHKVNKGDLLRLDDTGGSLHVSPT